MRFRELLIGGLLPLVITGCSSFGSPEPDPPAELTDFDEQIQLQRIWRADAGAGLGEFDMVLKPVLDGGTIYTVDRRGRVTAFAADTGRSRWRQDLDTHITGGVGLTSDLVLVGSQEGTLYALRREDGSQVWSRTLSSEILAPPDGNQQFVVAVTQDGRVHALSAADGAQAWELDIQKPLLTLRGNAQPRVTADRVYLGLDNGKLAAYRLADGGPIWEARVAIPEGTTELERMVDVDARPLIFSDLIFGLSYQGGLMAVDMASGRSTWFQEGSSRKDPAFVGGLILVSMIDGRVVAYNASTGTRIWESDALLNRGVTAPAAGDLFVAVGEMEEGYIHLFNRRTGNIIGREKVDSSGLSAAPMTDGGNLYVLDRDGNLQAYRLEQL